MEKRSSHIVRVRSGEDPPLVDCQLLLARLLHAPCCLPAQGIVQGVIDNDDLGDATDWRPSLHVVLSSGFVGPTCQVDPILRGRARGSARRAMGSASTGEGLRGHRRNPQLVIPDPAARLQHLPPLVVPGAPVPGRRLRLPAETSFFAEIDLRDVLGAALLAEPANPALLILPTSAQRADTSLSPWLLPCALSDSAFPHVIRVAAAEVLVVGPD